MTAEAYDSSQVRIFLSDGSDPVIATPAAISKAHPAVASGLAPLPPSGLQLGMPVYAQQTGFPELDNHFFLTGLDEEDETSMSLIGSDTTDSEGAYSAGAELVFYGNYALQSLCLSTFAYNLETPGTVSVGTYCNPKASLPATAGAPGTMTISGYIDVQDSAYPAVYQAVKDGKPRLLSIMLGHGQGELVQVVQFSSMTWDIPMGDGGMAWTATANLKTSPEHVWDDTAAVEAVQSDAPVPAPSEAFA